MSRLTIPIICAAYGISPAGLRQWRQKAGLAIDEFRDPCRVSQRLLAVAKNNSPRMQCLASKKYQLEIAFRLAVRGINPPTKNEN
jgi:hypothetical protein